MHTLAGDLFRKMLPDSKIAAKFSVAEIRSTYFMKFGVTVHTKRMLVNRVKGSSPFVVMFNESLDKSNQEKQMDIHV